LRHGLELPKFGTGANVERARVAGGTLRHFAAGGTDDRDILVERRRAAVRNADVDFAVGAEAGSGLAGGCVERNQVRAAHEQDPRSERAVAGPIAHAARRYLWTAAARSRGSAA